MVKWVIRVGLQEKENQSHDDATNVKYRLPVSSQDVQTNVALCVDIRVVHWCVAVDDWRLVRIVIWYFDREGVLPAIPQTIPLVSQVHLHAELHDVGLVNVQFDEVWLVQLLKVLR